MSKQYTKELKTTTNCIIKAIYNGIEYKSAVIKLSDNSNELESIKTLSEKGTNDMPQIKFPLSDNEFIIFSRKQLDNTLFTITVFDVEENNVIEIKKKSVKKLKTL